MIQKYDPSSNLKDGTTTHNGGHTMVACAQCYLLLSSGPHQTIVSNYNVIIIPYYVHKNSTNTNSRIGYSMSQHKWKQYFLLLSLVWCFCACVLPQIFLTKARDAGGGDKVLL